MMGSMRTFVTDRQTDGAKSLCQKLWHWLQESSYFLWFLMNRRSLFWFRFSALSTTISAEKNWKNIFFFVWKWRWKILSSSKNVPKPVEFGIKRIPYLSWSQICIILGINLPKPNEARRNVDTIGQSAVFVYYVTLCQQMSSCCKVLCVLTKQHCRTTSPH